MFGRRSTSKSEEPTDDGESPETAPEPEKPAPTPSSPADSRKVNLAAKKALLKAYYASAGYSPEQIAEALGEAAAAEDSASVTAQSVSDLSSQIGEIGKLVGDTVLQMENQITSILETVSGTESRFEDLQSQISTIYGNQQICDSGVTEVREGITKLQQETAQTREQLENVPAPQPAGESAGERVFALEEGTRETQKKLEELTARMEMDNAAVSKLQAKVGEIQKKGGSTLSETERRFGEQLRVTVEGVTESVEELRTVVQGVASQFDELRAEVQAAPSNLAARLDDLKNEIQSVSSGVDGRIHELKNEMTSASDIDGRINELKSEMQSAASGLDGRIGELRNELQSRPPAGDTNDLVRMRQDLDHLREITAQSRLHVEKKIQAMERIEERTSSALEELKTLATGAAAKGEGEAAEGLSKLRDELQQLAERVTRDRTESGERQKKIEGKMEQALSQAAPAGGPERLLSALDECIAELGRDASPAEAASEGEAGTG